MTWNYLAKVSCLDIGLLEHSLNWAQLPTPTMIADDVVRVYFATRAGNTPQIASIDVGLSSRKGATVISKTLKTCIVAPGTSSWNIDGVYPSSVIEAGERINLYTIGWQRGDVDPLYAARIGLATFDCNGQLVEVLSQPVLNLCAKDPFLVTSPTVRKFNGGFEMLYTSGDSWRVGPNGADSTYQIRRAVSHDGIGWEKDTDYAIKRPAGIQGFARPCFLGDSHDRIMLSVRLEGKSTYQLGIAERTNSKTSYVLSTSTDYLPPVGCAYPAMAYNHERNNAVLVVNDHDRGLSGFYMFESRRRCAVTCSRPSTF